MRDDDFIYQAIPRHIFGIAPGDLRAWGDFRDTRSRRPQPPEHSLPRRTFSSRSTHPGFARRRAGRTYHHLTEGTWYITHPVGRPASPCRSPHHAKLESPRGAQGPSPSRPYAGHSGMARHHDLQRVVTGDHGQNAVAAPAGNICRSAKEPCLHSGACPMVPGGGIRLKGARQDRYHGALHSVRRETQGRRQRRAAVVRQGLVAMVGRGGRRKKPTYFASSRSGVDCREHCRGRSSDQPSREFGLESPS